MARRPALDLRPDLLALRPGGGQRPHREVPGAAVGCDQLALPAAAQQPRREHQHRDHGHQQDLQHQDREGEQHGGEHRPGHGPRRLHQALHRLRRVRRLVALHVTQGRRGQRHPHGPAAAVGVGDGRGVRQVAQAAAGGPEQQERHRPERVGDGQPEQSADQLGQHVDDDLHGELTIGATASARAVDVQAQDGRACRVAGSGVTPCDQPHQDCPHHESSSSHHAASDGRRHPGGSPVAAHSTRVTGTVTRATTAGTAMPESFVAAPSSASATVACSIGRSMA